jgi:hypothetical protein
MIPPSESITVAPANEALPGPHIASAIEVPAPWPALPPSFLAGAKYLGSGHRVRGREAIACDAEGALDAAAVIGTLVRRGRRLLLLHQMHDE